MPSRIRPSATNRSTRSTAFVVLALAALLIPAKFAVAQDGKLKFEIYKDTGDQFRWRLKHPNGQVLATPGQGYVAKADCKHAVDTIKAEANTDKLKFESYEDAKKEFRWRLKASNGQVIATSGEGYKVAADCEKAIETIKKGAKDAEVAEVT